LIFSGYLQTFPPSNLEAPALDSSRYLQGDVLANATRPGWAVGGERYSKGKGCHPGPQQKTGLDFNEGVGQMGPKIP